MKIRTQLWLVFFGVTLVPLVVAGVIAYQVSRTRLLAEANENLVATVGRVARDFEDFRLRAEEGLRAQGLIPQFAEYLALPPEARGPHEAVVRQLLVNAIAVDPVNITAARLLDRAGVTVCRTGQGPSMILPVMPPWVVVPLTEGLPVIVLEGAGAEQAMWVSAPVRDATGAVVGCLSLRYEPAALQQIAARASGAVGSGLFVILIDGDGRVLAHGGDSTLKGSRWPEVLPARLSGSQGEEFFQFRERLSAAALRGGEAPDYVAKTPLAQSSWWVAVVSPARRHESAVRELRDIMLLLAGLGAVLSAVSTAYVAERLSRPLVRLSAAAERMGRGDFDLAVPTGGRGEVGLLVDAFNRMAEELRSTMRRLGERIEEVRRSEESRAELIAFSPVAIAEFGDDQRVIGLNAKFTELFGYTAADIATMEDWWPLAYPDPGYREQVQTQWEERLAEALARAGESRPLEAEVRTAAGETRQIEFRARRIGTRWVTIFLDLTDRVREEETRRRLEDQLRHAQKLEAVGTLAGGIAHDFNNVLIGIMGNTELALARLGPNDAVRELLGDAMAASRRARELVARILSFARQAEVDLKPVHIGPVIDEAARLLRSSLPGTITVETRLAEVVPAVLCDPIQIHQLVMNLGFNSAHAMPTGGVLRFELGEVRLTETDLERHPQLHEGLNVRLTVKDTGTGMDEATLTRVFEPFFTTKQVGEGTGLGLAVVHGILRTLDAAAVIRSELGRGTTFDLYFPGSGGAESEPGPSPAFSSIGRGETLLLVDDEAVVLQAMERILRTIGYRVESHLRPEEALAAVRSGRSVPDLMISDVSMPGMSGLELARAVRACLPACPVLLVTGNSLTLDAKALREAGVVDLLEKPFSMAEISATLARVLG